MIDTRKRSDMRYPEGFRAVKSDQRRLFAVASGMRAAAGQREAVGRVARDPAKRFSLYPGEAVLEADHKIRH